MPKRVDMVKKTMSIHAREAEFLDRRSAELCVTENEYLRRLIGLGSTVASLRSPADGNLEPTIRIELVATRGDEVIGRHQVSDLLI